VPGLRRNPRPAAGTGGGSRLSPSEVLERDALDRHGDVAGDAGLLQVGAVAAGDEGKHRGAGLSVAAWIAIAWVALVVVIAVLAKTGLVTWGDPQNSIASCAHKGPFSDTGTAPGHLLGCDSNGRDMMARLALGAWESLLVSVGAIVLGFTIGGGLGIVAGYFGGRSDTILTGMFNILLSVPAIVLALALVAFLQGSPENAAKSTLPDEVVLIIAIGVVSIPLVGRISRASALSWGQREFVLAARAQGAKHWRIMIRELLPNVAPAMFSIALLGVAIAIVAEGTLAILGVGVRPPTPSWGNIIALDRGELFTSPHIVFEASILIFLTVLALNFLGDVVRSRFDVREAGI
jgi:peptide/nickel transport system permease protein